MSEILRVLKNRRKELREELSGIQHLIELEEEYLAPKCIHCGIGVRTDDSGEHAAGHIFIHNDKKAMNLTFGHKAEL